VLVLDEPTAMLDLQGSRAIFNIIQRLSRMGSTVILAEHRLEWIAEYIYRVVVLANGEKILDGAPEQVLSSPRLVESGVGWTRYTQVADLAKARHLWPARRTLPVTLDGAVQGFREAQEGSSAYPD
jgi:ABC-type multidrug transport system ATPase subunit